MKTLAIVLLVFVAAVVRGAEVTEEEKQMMEQVHIECKAESGVSEELVDQVRLGKWPGPDDKFKAHTVCFCKKLGIMNDSGELQMDFIKKLSATRLDPETAEQLISKCVVQKDTPENTAYEMAQCAYNIKFKIV